MTDGSALGVAPRRRVMLRDVMSRMIVGTDKLYLFLYRFSTFKHITGTIKTYLTRSIVVSVLLITITYFMLWCCCDLAIIFLPPAELFTASFLSISNP